MKIFKLTYGLMAAAVFTLASCNINEAPEFDDADAFLAFSSSTASVSETAGSIEIPVMLASLSGLSASVTVEVDEASTAVEGKDYTIEGNTLNFSAGNATQYVKINVADDDEFTGNRTIVLRLNSTNVNLGAAKKCTVTIEDNEHPLRFILGTYSANLTSAFSSRGSWAGHEITIERDADDINKVWIGNLDPYFAQYGFIAPDYNYFYGIVNEDKTEISIPCGQETGYTDSDGIGISLYGFEDPEADTAPVENGSIILKIQEDGNTLFLENAYGVCMTTDLSSGWYNIVLGQVTFTKK